MTKRVVNDVANFLFRKHFVLPDLKTEMYFPSEQRNLPFIKFHKHRLAIFLNPNPANLNVVRSRNCDLNELWANVVRDGVRK